MRAATLPATATARLAISSSNMKHALRVVGPAMSRQVRYSDSPWTPCVNFAPARSMALFTARDMRIERARA